MEKEQNKNIIEVQDDKYIFMTTKQRGWKPHAISASDKMAIIGYIQENKHNDTYYTPNVFKEPTSNTKDNLAELRAIVIDVDDHISGGFTLEQAKAFVSLLEPHFNADIPTPYRVIFTGRGMQFNIKLEPSTDIAKYDLVSKGIFKQYDKLIGEYQPLTQLKLQADKQAIGSRRFCRMLGTYNTIAKTYTSGIYSSAATYSLDLLIDGFIPELEPITKGKAKASDVYAQNQRATFKQYRKEFTAQTWRYAAIDDLKAIQGQRNELRKLNDKYYYNCGNIGHRNVMLFYYGLLCKWAFNDSQEVLDSMQAFNQFYGSSILSHNEVMATFNSVISHDYKPPKAQTMIDNLGITSEEMASLKVVIDRTEKLNRKNKGLRNKRAIQAHSKALDKQAIIGQVKELHASGLSYRAIARELKIDHKTAQRYNQM